MDWGRSQLPQGRSLDLAGLFLLLGEHQESQEKERVGLWIPASFAPGARRKLEAVESVSCLVLDFDGGHDPDDFAESWDERGLCYLLHSSYSHTSETPKWRAVFPLLHPVLGSEWDRVWTKLEFALGFGVTDRACRDASRMYYLPSCAPGAPRFTRVHQGRLLDPAEIPDIEETEAQAGPTPTAGDGTRPGDDFERKADWPAILEPHGFTRYGQWQGMTLWWRPGKKRGCPSVRTGEGKAGDRLYCWSSNAGLPVGRVLTKFAVYAHLEMDGDFALAAKALAAAGYGQRAASGLGLSGEKSECTSEPTGSPRLTVEEGGAVRIPEPDVEDLGALSELGIGKLYAETVGGTSRYVSEWGSWIHWNGSCWEKDAPENPGARRRAHELVDAINDKAWHFFDAKRMAFAGKCRQSKMISAMITEGKARPGIAIRPWSLDTHDWILPARNGVIDLKTGELRPHDPDLLYTRCVPHDYDPNAKAPRFEQFLMEISKERVDLVDLLLCLLGYSLTGSTREHKWAVLYGERGRNGKSTLLETVQRIMGDYCGLIDKALLLQNRFGEEARFSKAEIEGRRMIYASEARKGAAFNAEFIKDFVGASRLRAERKGKDGYEFDVKAKLWYAVNSFPRVDFDSAWAARIIPIPFEQSFYSKEDSEYQKGDIPPDRELSETLVRESSGILTLMVQGCLRWQSEGFPTVKSVAALVAEYREDNDHIGIWLSEQTEYDDDSRMLMSTAFSEYNKWADRMGFRKYSRVNEFTERIRQDQRLKFAKPGNRSTIYGLRLADGQPSLREE